MPAASPAVMHRACPLCGSDDFRVLLTRAPWRLVECAACHLAYLPEIPTVERVATEFEWQVSFARERWERWQRNPFTRIYTCVLAFLKPSRERRALRRIRRTVRNGRLLDIACGDGRFAALALHAGFDPLGTEFSPRMAAKAIWRLGAERVRIGRLEDLVLPPASFDVITVISFLEHDPQPSALLGQALNLLRPGGALFVKVPNYDSLLRRWRGARWSGYRWPEHVQYFTLDTLGRIVRAAGFAVSAVDAPRLGDNMWLTALRPPG